MTNKRPSRRRIKKWAARSWRICVRAYDRGPIWFFRQCDLTARQQRVAKRYGYDVLHALRDPASVDYEAIKHCLTKPFGRARPR